MTCYSVSHRHDYISCEALKENGLRWYGGKREEGQRGLGLGREGGRGGGGVRGEVWQNNSRQVSQPEY